jgi:hypothetical protein
LVVPVVAGLVGEGRWVLLPQQLLVVVLAVLAAGLNYGYPLVHWAARKQLLLALAAQAVPHEPLMTPRVQPVMMAQAHHLALGVLLGRAHWVVVVQPVAVTQAVGVAAVLMELHKALQSTLRMEVAVQLPQEAQEIAEAIAVVVAAVVPGLRQALLRLTLVALVG